MAEVLADDPAAEGNHAEYDHDPRIGRPACVDRSPQLGKVIVRFHGRRASMRVEFGRGPSYGRVSVTGADLGLA